MEPDRAVDEGLSEYLASLRSDPDPPARAIGVGNLRAASRERTLARPLGPPMSTVEDFTIDGPAPVQVRLYRPVPAARPVVVYFHGGGWVFGDLESHDRICRRLARHADVAVLAVDYRLAPEHPWPAAVDDALTVLRWLGTEGLPWPAATAIGVAGDSAGGTVAALCCLALRDANVPQPTLQALIYPTTDLTCSQPSIETTGAGWDLTDDDVRWFAELWVPDAVTRANPRVSPLLEPDLRGLAPSLLVMAEHDPLRDEGELYATRLAAAGVPTVTRVEAGLVHGFLNLDLVSDTAGRAGNRIFDDIGRLLRAETKAGST